MAERLALIGAMSGLLVVCTSAGGFVQAPQPQFRAGIILVPIDVRVLDRAGNPVTDLAADDFRILENGIPQHIAHFIRVALEPDASVAAEPLQLRGASETEFIAERRRTFVVVLGRGRLQLPSRGMDALIEFVRTRLLPQDQVAVVAYDRTALFTTEHAKVVRLMERYRDHHEAIEAALDHWFSGLTFLFGSRTPPPGIQRDIDKLFDAPGLPEIRQRLYGGEVDFEEDRRRILTSDFRLIGDAIEPEAVLRPEAPDDFEKLYSAIEELRHVQGEKHLIVLTDWGIGGTRAVHTDGLAAAAADARVAVWTVQTGGLAAFWDPDGRFMSRGWLQLFNMGDSRAASEHTGGEAWFHQFSDGPLDRIDRATRFHYLLGYYPSNARWDGANRAIEVTVTRPDVRVLHRRSYFANQTLVPYDRRRFIAYSRVLSAAAGPVARDIQVKLAASVTRRDAGNAAVAVEVAITPSTVRFIDRNGRHEAALNVAIFAASASGTLLGEKWDRVDLQLPPATFARLARESIVYTATLDLPGVPRHLKAVVYDAFADRLGSATREVR